MMIQSSIIYLKKPVMAYGFIDCPIAFGKANLFMRIFAQLSFLIQCIIRGLFSYKTTDLLISTSPPMAAICAVVIGFLEKS